MRSSVLLVAAFVALPSLACSKKIDANFEGGITMRTTVAGNAPQEMQLEIKAGKLRFDMHGENAEPMHGIYDPTANQVLIFLDAQHTFMKLDFAAAGAAAPNTTAEASTAEKTGSKDRVAGIACENWVAKEPSGKRSEVCVVDGVNFFDLTRLRGGAAGLAGMGKPGMQDKKMFPLRSVEFDAQGHEISRMEVTRVDAHPVDDARFGMPVGYQQLEVPTLKTPQ